MSLELKLIIDKDTAKIIADAFKENGVSFSHNANESSINEDAEKYLSCADVVSQYGYNLSTIQRKCKSGEIPAEKVFKEWRIKKEDLDRILLTPKK